MTGSILFARNRSKLALHSLCIAILLGFVSLAGRSAAAQTLGPVQLSLVNGWTDGSHSGGHAMVEELYGIVHLRGTIANGSSAVAFTLPAAFRPSGTVYLVVTLCNAHKGDLTIQPTGVVTVGAETAFSDAQCFTSLDGASFVQSASGSTALMTTNGAWAAAPGDRFPAVKLVQGRVHFIGAFLVTSGTYIEFQVPAGFHPARGAHLEVDLCGAYKGYMQIEGDLGYFQYDGGTSCYTSLDGASYPASTTGYSAIVPTSDWAGSPRNALVIGSYGIVFLDGLLDSSLSNTNAQLFTLPTRFRPTSVVYLSVALGGIENHHGWVIIDTNGNATVTSEDGFSYANFETSLSGVSFFQ